MTTREKAAVEARAIAENIVNLVVLRLSQGVPQTTIKADLAKCIHVGDSTPYPSSTVEQEGRVDLEALEATGYVSQSEARRIIAEVRALREERDEAHRGIEIQLKEIGVAYGIANKAEAELAALRAERNGLISRLRTRWPHIEIVKDGQRVDPGPRTCLRCCIEDEIGPPFHDGLGPKRGTAAPPVPPAEKREEPVAEWLKCPWCRREWLSPEDGPEAYESCPLCYGSFSFGKPVRTAHPRDPESTPQPETPERAASGHAFIGNNHTKSTCLVCGLTRYPAHAPATSEEPETPEREK